MFKESARCRRILLSLFLFCAFIFCSSSAIASDSQESLLHDEADALPVKYIGNAESHKFHKPSCPYARIMAFNKRVPFHFRRQAIACGHKPCHFCLPPVWTELRGKILTPLKGSEQNSSTPARDPP